MQVVSQSILLKALGWSLVNSLWQMAALWLIYLIVTGTGNRFTARVRHNLALLLNTIGFTCFVVNFISTFNDGILSDDFASFMVSRGNGFYGLISVIKKIIIVSLPYLSTIYLALLSFLTIRYLNYFIRLQTIKSTGLNKIQPELRLFTRFVAAQMGISKKVAVWLSSVVDSPMTIGFLKPIILIPVATVNHLTMEQVETILLHELAHIKRNDYLVNLFVTVCGIIFFFNPFSKLFINTIKKEREHSCDDLVIQFQYNPHAYASALLSLEKTRHKHHQFAMSAIGKSSQLLLERIKRVTGHKYMTRHYSFSVVCCFVLAVVTGLLVVLNPKQTSFKIMLPPTVVNSNSIQPTEHTFYFINSAPTVAAKAKGVTKPAPKKKTDEVGDSYWAADLVQVKNNEPENTDADEEENKNDDVITADQTETRDFSIVTPENTDAPAVEGTNVYPYVPNSSFSFNLVEDTLVPTKPIMNMDDVNAAVSLQKTLKAMDQIDWKKIEQQLAKSGNKVQVKALKEQVIQSLRNVDWDKVNQQVPVTLSVVEEKRLRDNITVQERCLKDLKQKNQAQARTLQKQIMQQQYLLKQVELNKEVESIKSSNEQLRKKILRIIYI